MAVITEFYKTRHDGAKLFRTYSDNGFTLLQNETGIEYADAVDVEDSGYTYTEIENSTNTEEATEADYQSALARLGVE